MQAKPSSHHAIRLFRFAEDAWQGGLKDWLQAQASVCLAGEEAWLVAADTAQAAWIRRRAGLEGLSLLGIRFLTAGSLRKELSRLLGSETRLLGRESLEFLLKLEALKHDSAEARAVALNPGPCLQALDDLGRAGWSGDETDMGEVPSPIGRWLKVLTASKAWTSAIDTDLLARARKPVSAPLHLCFWAWDAGFYPEKLLLEAALRAAASSELYVPLPIADPDMAWVEELERVCGVGHDVCPASDYRSTNEALVEHLFRRGEGESVPAAPVLMTGATQEDQVDLAERQVLKWLPDCGREDRIGVVAPPSSPTGRLLLRRLLEAGIPVQDEAGGRVPPDASAVLQKCLARYYLSGEMVEEFLSLLAAAQQIPGAARLPDPVRLRAGLHDIFGGCPTRRVPLLMEKIGPDAGPVLQAARKLAEGLGAWPQEAGWAELKTKWQAACDCLGVGVECLEPLWSRLDAVLADRRVQGRAFLEYVNELLESARFARDEEAVHPFAKVALVTLAKASYQSWKHLIFLDSNEGVWPISRDENPFLDDGLRRSLNQKRGPGYGRLLATLDLARLEQKRLMDLLENCRGEAALLAQGFDTLNPVQPLYPNELFLQCLMLEAGDKPVLKLWEDRIQSDARPTLSAGCDAILAGKEARHLAEVRRRRMDPALPFDEYSFCYPPGSGGNRSWSVTGLEKACEYPATFALRQLFRAESAQEQNFERNERWITGILAHEWIRRCLKDGLPGAAELEKRRQEVERQLREEFLATRTLWRETVFQSCRWAVRECLSRLCRQDAGRWEIVKSEEPIEGHVTTEGGILALRGRMDLVLRNRAEWSGSDAWIVDFKTSRRQTPTPQQLERGEGLQFAGYLLLALEQGAKTVSVQCLSPRTSGGCNLTGEHAESARRGLALAARLLASCRFGMKGALFDDYKRTEMLPMATVPVDLQILEAKAALTHERESVK
ncbi:MAG: PD-(D/E)XK nuclease family protein [Methylacidiphilales bacterium]|nr:PD-(D/E)XK nuclease family protein [Candidatus Methylacidiphilales bacterium]